MPLTATRLGHHFFSVFLSSSLTSKTFTPAIKPTTADIFWPCCRRIPRGNGSNCYLTTYKTQSVSSKGRKESLKVERNPRDSPLWHLLDEYFDKFEECYDDLLSKEYGFYRPVVSLIVRKYLECGDLHQGFARVRCPDCHHEYLLSFSCRGWYFCPSCHAKKAVQFAAHLRENVLYPVPHRQYVSVSQRLYAAIFSMIENCLVS